MPPPPSPEELVLARRAWRLAVLTTGDLAVARAALESLPSPHAGDRLDADRIDRLAIQAIRRSVGPERRARGAPADDGAIADAPAMPAPREPALLGPAHAVLAALPLQAAEAWVLRRLDELDPIRACRAMDCSRSAADRFLDRADRDLRDRLGAEHDAAIAQLGAASESLAPAPEVVAICTGRSRQRMRRRIAIALSVCAALLAAIFVAASLLS